MSETTPSGPRPALRELIRDAMRAKGIRSIDGEKGLARLAGVSRNTIYAWEGGAYPRIGELERLGRLLELPAWRLLQAWEAGEGRGSIADEREPYDVDDLVEKVDAIITRDEVLELVAGVEARVTSEIQTNRAAIIEALAGEFVDAALRKLAQTPDGARLLGIEDPQPEEEEPPRGPSPSGALSS